MIRNAIKESDGMPPLTYKEATDMADKCLGTIKLASLGA